MSQTTPLADDLYIGAGRLFFDRFTSAGVKTGLRFLGDVSELSITPAEDEVREKYTSTEPSRGLLKRVPIRRKVTFAATLSEWSPENLALVLMGERASYTQAGASPTGEVLSTAPLKGVSYQTSKRVISAITLKRGATTIPAGEYEVVSTESGIIFLKDTAPTFDGAAGDLTIDYTHAAITGDSRPWIKGAKTAVIEGELLYLGNPTTGPKHELKVWKLSISPSEDLGLISDDWGDIKIKGEVLADSTNHPNEPYYQVIEMPA